MTPKVAVLERGADVIIVGRGITQAEDPAAAALVYKEEAYAAYLERIAQKAENWSARGSKLVW